MHWSIIHPGNTDEAMKLVVDAVQKKNILSLVSDCIPDNDVILIYM